MVHLRSFKVDGVQCVDAGGGSARYPQVDGLTLKLDASWAPYVQATLTGPPPSPADVTAIEPRDGWRVRFTVRSFDGAGTELKAVPYDLGLRRRVRTHQASGARFLMEAASSEAVLQDWALGTLVESGADDSRPHTALDWVQPRITAAGLSLTVVDGAPDGIVSYSDVGWTPDRTVWDYVSTLADAVGARIYCDEQGQLLWASPTYSPVTGTQQLTQGVITVEDTVSRDDPAWGNFAVVAYNGSDPVAYVVSDSGSNRRKAIVQQRRGRKPGSGNAATKIRTTAQKRGRSLVVTAIASLRVAPSQTWQVVYEDQQWTGVVQSVEFSIPAGTMQLVLNITEA